MKSSIAPLLACLLVACGAKAPGNAAQNTADIPEPPELSAPVPPNWARTLPADIEAEIVDYLNREYGAPDHSRALTVAELAYVGEFTVKNRPVRYWKYPCGAETRCWARVQPYGNSYYIDMSSIPPPGS